MTVEISNMSMQVFSKETKEELGTISVIFFPRMETIVLPDKSLEERLSKDELEALRRQIFERTDKWARTMEIG